MLLDDGKLVYGTLPDEEGKGSGESAGGTVPDQSTATSATQADTSSSGGQTKVGSLSIKMNYNDKSTNVNAIAGTLEITNTGKTKVDLSKIKINYYFKKEGGDMVFDCYHAATNSASGKYTELTSKVKGKYSSCTGEDRDTCLAITVGGGSLAKGDTLTISFSAHRSDWANMDLSNDWSHKDVKNIEIVN